MGSNKQPLFGMERSVIHYNHGSLFQGRQKLVGKPEFKKSAVHRPAILKRCKNLIRHFSGNNATALIFSTTNSSEHLLTPQCISIFPIQVRIHAGFIYISNLFWRYILDFFLISRYFLCILLLVTSWLFFVLCDTMQAHCESRFHCIQAPLPFPSDMRQDVPPHMLSAFPDLFFGNLCAALFSQIPCFFQLFLPFLDRRFGYLEGLMRFFQRMPGLSIFYCTFPIFS